jgi:hypothetical protein
MSPADRGDQLGDVEPRQVLRDDQDIGRSLDEHFREGERIGRGGDDRVRQMPLEDQV